MCFLKFFCCCQHSTSSTYKHSTRTITVAVHKRQEIAVTDQATYAKHLVRRESVVFKIHPAPTCPPTPAAKTQSTITPSSSPATSSRSVPEINFCAITLN